MVQITIEIPDDFAQRLEPFQNQLSELFTRFISTTLLGGVSEISSSVSSTSPSMTYQEVLDFLISRPTSQQILGFKVSEKSQVRLQNLLQKNRDAALSPEEKRELDLYEQLDTLMGLLKARAFVTLKPNTPERNVFLDNADSNPAIGWKEVTCQ